MSKTTTLSRELALKMYQGTDEQLKAFDLENYPDLSKSPFEVKSFAEVCEQMDKDPSRYEIESTDSEDIFLNQVERIMLICKYYRQGKKTGKWWPYFYTEKDSTNPSGFRSDVSVFTRTDSTSVLGPLLWLPDQETSDYVGRTFEPEFRKAILLNQ